MSPDDPTVLPGILIEHKRSVFDVNQEKRTSTLNAPKERIEDSKNQVLTCAIDPTGELILSGGRDRLIRMCRVYSEHAGNVVVMSGHTGTVTQVNFSADGTHFYSCSGDKTVSNWDTYRCLRIDQFKAHKSYVYSVQSSKGTPLLCSSSEDGTVKIWDLRTKECTTNLESGYRIFGACFSNSGNKIICAGASNNINIWDIRKKDVVCRIRGHTAPVTGIDLSPCGAFLLSHSLDSTLRTWDIRSTSIPHGRNIHRFPSYQQSSYRHLLRCAWSKRGHKVAAGCADGQQVSVWDLKTRKMFCKLPIHNDAVNDIAFHPQEPIVLTASSDKYLYLTEIDF